MLKEPLDDPAVKRLISAILRTGTVTITRHAYEEMEADGLSEIDVQNVLRAGWLDYPEPAARGSWRYRMRTQRIWVVIAFRSETELVVITVWRKKQ